ncbi:unnamed protein product [Eruca vesicaria subsp. sativa]|uniref:Uncharacterized protein n=1 Tax=Eruca vesicaria subsp. sativa TaxID=29727 RepID=A0ABC8IYZ1_ERUVS|nr:unnamed protein product [Eruca vesicaria subsp. sativa]
MVVAGHTGGYHKLGKQNTQRRVPSGSGADVSITAGERLSEGALQLIFSSVISVIGNLKSGGNTTTKEWLMLPEIQSRVRLDAFEKFVPELTN